MIAYRKIGGIHFVNIGTARITACTVKAAKPAKAAPILFRPFVESVPGGFVSGVNAVQGRDTVRTMKSPNVMPDAAIAMAHARAAIVACGFKVSR